MTETEQQWEKGRFFESRRDVSEAEWHIPLTPIQKTWERPLWQQPRGRLSKSIRNMEIFRAEGE